MDLYTPPRPTCRLPRHSKSAKQSAVPVDLYPTKPPDADGDIFHDALSESAEGGNVDDVFFNLKGEELVTGGVRNVGAVEWRVDAPTPVAMRIKRRMTLQILHRMTIISRDRKKNKTTTFRSRFSMKLPVNNIPFDGRSRG